MWGSGRRRGGFSEIISGACLGGRRPHAPNGSCPCAAVPSLGIDTPVRGRQRRRPGSLGRTSLLEAVFHRRGHSRGDRHQAPLKRRVITASAEARLLPKSRRWLERLPIELSPCARAHPAPTGEVAPSRHRLGLERDQHLASLEAQLVLNLPRKIETPHSRRIPQMKDDPRFAASRICRAAQLKFKV